MLEIHGHYGSKQYEIRAFESWTKTFFSTRSEVSERASQQMSAVEQCRASERVRHANEQANEREGDPVLTSGFLFVSNHSALLEIHRRTFSLFMLSCLS